MNKNETLANSIKLLRKTYSYTQEQVSNYLGITQPAYYKYEKGTAEIPMDKIEKLAELYNVDEYDLMTGNTAKAQADMVFAFRKGAEDLNLTKVAQFQKIVKNYLEILHELGE